MSHILLNASNARMGGGLVFYESLTPLLVRSLEERGHSATVVGPCSPASAQILLARYGHRAAAILNYANVAAALYRGPQVTCVRNRLLVEDTPAVCGAAMSTDKRGRRRSLAIRRHALAVSLRRSARWIVPSLSMQEALIRFARRQSIRDKPIDVIPHGCDIAHAPSWPVGFDKTIVLYPSHYAGHKNFETLIEAVGRLELGEIELVLTVSPEDGPGLGRSLGEFANRTAEGRVRFAGRVTRPEMARLYQGAHIVAFPSLIESFGMPLFEAQVSNRRIVASDLDWAREACGVRATYVAPCDIDGWADALRLAADRSSEPPPVESQSYIPGWQRVAEQYIGRLMEIL